MCDKHYIWDRFIRLFHWSLVASFIAATVFEDERILHEIFGYFLFAIVILRLVYGFVGSHHARFINFIRSPRSVFAYLKSIYHRNPAHYMGHNPAGGAMIAVLLLGMIALCLTGIMLGMDRFWGEEWVEELHGGLHFGLIILIVIHVAAVLLSTIFLKEKLIKAMITGWKDKNK